MKQYNISFSKNDVFQSRLCNAETADQARAYFESIEPTAEVIAVDINNEGYKPGKPCETVPEGWTAPTTEKENESMKEFTEIKREVTQDGETRKSNTAFYIENGFMPSWTEEHHSEPDRGLREHSTKTRWNQYKAGTITREKAVEYATARMMKAIEKETAAHLAQLDEVAQAADLNFITISVYWVRSQTGGHNPRVEVKTNTGAFMGSASGCGYDKESAAIADALNKSNSILKALYTLKENGLRAGQSDKSKTASCGRSNNSICGYGAGYGAIPYFEGGVGVNCFLAILKKCGFKTIENHGKYSDFYNIEKEVWRNDNTR